LLAELLEAEGIAWVGPRTAESSVSAILPLNGDRAFVTVAPPYELDTDAMAALDPRAVVLDLANAGKAPPGTAAYAVTGDIDAQALAGRLPEMAAGVRTLLVNEPEACHLSGLDDPEQAAVALAESGPTVVVTLGARGAICAGEHGLARADAPAVNPVDTNGAGDLFTAAWVWADLAGSTVQHCLELAVIYASLSVRVPTTAAGALRLDQLRAQAPDATIPQPGARR
ncbi:MAG: carbohydrate kinase family protein, partial [Gaiellales bacterium]